MPLRRRVRRVAVALVGGGALAAALTVPSFASSPSASASPGWHQPQQPPVVAGSGYLALGDSVAFGYREATTSPPPDYADPTSFVGYPENIGAALDLKVANATCPGETSGSLISTSNQSYACETEPGGTPGYRAAFPLHVTYQNSHESQLSFAVDYLRSHRNIRLVSLGIGANDGFLCQATTADNCASELPAVLASVKKNVGTILRTLRDQAGYRGQLVIVDYYSLDYANAADNASSQSLNAAMAAGAKPYDVEIADEYSAFQNAALHSGSDSCTAGLLTQLTTGGCGVHPSVAGQDVLAQTINSVINKTS